MVELYIKRGLSAETAERIVEILAKNKPALVDVMMHEELGALRRSCRRRVARVPPIRG